MEAVIYKANLGRSLLGPTTACTQILETLVVSMPSSLSPAFWTRIRMDDVIEDRCAVHAGEVSCDALGPDGRSLVVRHDHNVVNVPPSSGLAEVAEEGDDAGANELGEGVEEGAECGLRRGRKAGGADGPPEDTRVGESP